MKNFIVVSVISASMVLFCGCIADSVCLSDADCKAPEFCDKDSGNCRVECTDAADCEGSAYICRDNVCVLSGGADGDSDNDGEFPELSCPEDMLPVENLFCIDRYEAARADAAADNAGSDNSSAPQSAAGLLPWTGISQSEAAAACTKAGKRLCGPDEWYQACRGPRGQTYSYGRDYNPLTCNGIDSFCAEPEKGCGKKEADAGIRNFHMTTSGDFEDCTNEYGVFDINGNVWEWDSSPEGHGRGGAYNCIDSEKLHRCDFIKTDTGANASPNVGFRCCNEMESGK